MNGQLNMERIYDMLEKQLEKAGFKPFAEFTAVDGMIHGNSSVGYYGLKRCEHIGTAVHHENLKYAVELDCEFDIRLMGKMCDYADGEEFEIKCESFYSGVVLERELLISRMEMGGVYYETSLRRLAREVKLCLRVCLEDE